jgi:hypothetical protein
LLADLATNDRELRGGIGVIEAPIRSRIRNLDRGFKVFSKRGGWTEGRDFVFRNRDALYVAAPDDRPACIAPATQTFEFVGGHDMLAGADALMGFPMPAALLIRMSEAFAAGLLPLF